MLRKGSLVVLAGLLLASIASAQPTAARFRWQAGQVLTYRVEQTTTVAEEAGQEKSGSQSRLNLTKRWQVVQVDSAGVATLQLSLTALRLETTPPSGEALVFDSAHPDKSAPQMREQMERYIGPPLAVLRLDARGQVVEVKESKFGPASRYQNELPFAIVLPEKDIDSGLAWERSYQLTLDPPQGAGEKFEAMQKYACTKLAGSTATITLATALKTTPESVLDQVPLVQLQPQGEVVFDVRAGIVRSSRLSIDKELTGHQGEGSKYRFRSTYTEDYVESR